MGGLETCKWQPTVHFNVLPLNSDESRRLLIRIRSLPKPEGSRLLRYENFLFSADKPGEKEESSDEKDEEEVE